MNVRNFLKLSRSQWIGVAIMTPSLGLALAVTMPASFTAGTPISASQVNANFSALNGALPLLWASTDTTNLGTSVSAAGRTTINSVAISVPAAGNLVISGSVFIVNSTAGSTNYLLDPLIDGAGFIPGATPSLEAIYASSPTAGVVFTLSYTVTVPVTVAGLHTISQQVGLDNGGTATYTYNRNNLNVIFFPASQSTFNPA